MRASEAHFLRENLVQRAAAYDIGRKFDNMSSSRHWWLRLNVKMPPTQLPGRNW